tara:strand:- start:25151 stop:25393 length:243 start_codon:yes stop_codon:yes gene_type:complete
MTLWRETLHATHFFGLYAVPSHTTACCLTKRTRALGTKLFIHKISDVDPLFLAHWAVYDFAATHLFFTETVLRLNTVLVQ